MERTGIYNYLKYLFANLEARGDFYIRVVDLNLFQLVYNIFIMRL